MHKNGSMFSKFEKQEEGSERTLFRNYDGWQNDTEKYHRESTAILNSELVYTGSELASMNFEHKLRVFVVVCLQYITAKQGCSAYSPAILKELPGSCAL